MAALTEVRICNIALIKIGADRITSLSQNKKEAKVCNHIYESSRDSLLRSHPWNFATARVALTQIGTSPISFFAYQYQLPTSPKCLRVLEITESVANWTVEGDYLLTDDSAVEIRYIQRVTDTSKFDSLFVAALTFSLASQLAIAITTDQRLANDMEIKFNSAMLKARGIDHVESNTQNDEPAMWGDA